MTAESEIIAQIIAAAPEKSAAADAQIANLGVRIADLQAQKDALTTLMAQAADEVVVQVNINLAAIVATPFLILGPNYGVINLTDWIGYRMDDVANIFSVTTTSFQVYGDYYHSCLGMTIAAYHEGAWHGVWTITGGNYDSGTNIATLVVSGSELFPANATQFRTVGIVYKYGGIGWVHDDYIYKRVIGFAKAYEHINADIGADGSFGLTKMIANLITLENMSQADKAFYDSLATRYNVWTT